MLTEERFAKILSILESMARRWRRGHSGSIGRGNERNV